MSRPKIALTGNVALEVLASYFRDAGYDVMREDESADEFRPDYIYDVTAHDGVLADEVAGFRDERMARLSGCPYSLAGIRAIVEEFGWLVAAKNAKVLAVDADNTLWRGIVSEDGFDGVCPYPVFQAGLRVLRDAGVVLVLLSKNDPFVAPKLPPVDLGLFACQKVNWAPKAGNLVEACRELNLGTDAVVFVDDNPHERAQMAAHLPEVAVAPWNGFAADGQERAERQLLRRLREYFFAAVGTTEEDRLRAADYARRAKTLLGERRFASHDDYLEDLGLWVRPALATAGDLDRLAQMAGKTNQFNATTLRRTREDFERLLSASAGGMRVYVFRAGDRFGEQGLVCYLIVDVAARRVTDFVMSCRAMGRTLEHFALAYAERELGSPLAVDFVPTAKNQPFADFLASVPGGLKSHFREVR